MSRLALISQTLLAGGTLIALTLVTSSQSIQSAVDVDPTVEFRMHARAQNGREARGSSKRAFWRKCWLIAAIASKAGRRSPCSSSSVEAHNVSVARWRADNEVEIQIAEEAVCAGKFPLQSTQRVVEQQDGFGGELREGSL